MATATQTTFPALACWNSKHRYFVQLGDGSTAEWFRRDGVQIDRDELYPYGDTPFYYDGPELGDAETVAEALALLDQHYADCEYDQIHLADNEWGNRLMQEVAETYFASKPDYQFVLVYEHAGWYLGFRRDGSIWCTANDQAVLTHRWPQPGNGVGKVIRR